MKAVILAGGLGTRLRPLTYEIPKPLIPVKKRPILNHLLGLFGRNGVTSTAILVSREHQADFKRWQKTWEDELGDMEIKIVHEDEPRGTFGGVDLLRDWLGDESFILSNGDELKDFDLGKLLDFHKTAGGISTIALVEVPNPHEYGVPVREGNLIKEFLEKPANPPANFISSGLYVLEPAVFEYADRTKNYLMIERDIFPKLASLGMLYGLEMTPSRWYDCGTMERWERAIREW